MKMNIANRITLVRVFLVPVFAAAYLTDWMQDPLKAWICMAIFLTASLSDLVDGQLARRMHIVTDFGKFMDPLADKLLVSTALICLSGSGVVPAWVSVILIGREFVISGFRLIAAEKGVVIAAGIWGKLKTLVQMVAIIMILSPITALWFRVLAMVLLYASVALSIISVVDYIVRNKAVLEETKE